MTNAQFIGNCTTRSIREAIRHNIDPRVFKDLYDYITKTPYKDMVNSLLQKVNEYDRAIHAQNKSINNVPVHKDVADHNKKVIDKLAKDNRIADLSDEDNKKIWGAVCDMYTAKDLKIMLITKLFLTDKFKDFQNLYGSITRDSKDDFIKKWEDICVTPDFLDRNLNTIQEIKDHQDANPQNNILQTSSNQDIIDKLAQHNRISSLTEEESKELWNDVLGGYIKNNNAVLGITDQNYITINSERFKRQYKNITINNKDNFKMDLLNYCVSDPHITISARSIILANQINTTVEIAKNILLDEISRSDNMSKDPNAGSMVESILYNKDVFNARLGNIKQYFNAKDAAFNKNVLKELAKVKVKYDPKSSQHTPPRALNPSINPPPMPSRGR